MHTRPKVLALLVLVGALAVAPPVQAKVQLGDLLKKVTGKSKDQDKDKTPPKDTAKAANPAASKADALQDRTAAAAEKGESKVDDFKDANNDGVDDRKQIKVRRDKPRQAPADAPPATKRTTRRGQPDTAKSRPPR